jgi:hypothetical protein
MLFYLSHKWVASRLTAKGVHRVDHRIDLRFDYPVEDVPTVPPVGYQPSVPQHHEMLRDVRLAQAKYGLHVTNALLPIPQHIQDRQAGGMHQRFVGLSLGLKIFHNLSLLK